MKRSKRAAKIAGRFLAFGFAGWCLENLLQKEPRYSWVFGGLRPPILPVFGAGGVLLGELAPLMKNRSLAERAAIYATIFAMLEYAAGNAERAFGHESWDYEGETVDIPHTVGWAALALAAEPFLRDKDEP